MLSESHSRKRCRKSCDRTDLAGIYQFCCLILFPGIQTDLVDFFNQLILRVCDLIPHRQSATCDFKVGKPHSPLIPADLIHSRRELVRVYPLLRKTLQGIQKLVHALCAQRRSIIARKKLPLPDCLPDEFIPDLSAFCVCVKERILTQCDLLKESLLLLRIYAALRQHLTAIIRKINTRI